jgi:hypothetical protein
MFSCIDVIFHDVDDDEGVRLHHIASNINI